MYTGVCKKKKKKKSKTDACAQQLRIIEQTTNRAEHFVRIEITYLTKVCFQKS